MISSEIVGLQFELLCHIANKYEPDVAALIDEYSSRQNKELQYVRVYQALERLSEQNLVAKKPIDGRSNCYMLTLEGAEFLVDQRDFVLDYTSELKELQS